MINTIKQFIKAQLASKAPLAVYLYRGFMDFKLSLRRPVQTPLEFQFTGTRSMENGSFEPGETKVFTEQLQSCDVVVNVGANTGYYCCIALHRKKSVIAFEPMPYNVKTLLKNISANGWEEGFEIFPVALGSSCGIGRIYGSGTSASFVRGWAGAPEDHSLLVPRSTLDSALGKRLSGRRCLMMVDIEGFEKEFLAGASFMLDMEPRPVWMIEISIQAHQPKHRKRNPDFLSVFTIFWSRGYDVWTTHAEHRRVPREEVERIAAGGDDTLWGDTFLFLPAREAEGGTRGL